MIAAVALLCIAGAFAWRAFDDYRDRVKLRRKWEALAETERLCREQKEKQWARGVAPISGKHMKRAA